MVVATVAFMASQKRIRLPKNVNKIALSAETFEKQLLIMRGKEKGVCSYECGEESESHKQRHHD
jgi:hypothetical protein